MIDYRLFAFSVVHARPQRFWGLRFGPLDVVVILSLWWWRDGYWWWAAKAGRGPVRTTLVRLGPVQFIWRSVRPR